MDGSRFLRHAAVLAPLLLVALPAGAQFGPRTHDDCEWHRFSTGFGTVVDWVKSSAPATVAARISNLSGAGGFLYRCKKSGTATISFTYLDVGDEKSGTLTVVCEEECDLGCLQPGQPGATLLFPYFEVDLAGSAGITTLVAINNALPDPRLARVTLWTDWGVPTLSFYVLLSGFDVQTLNLRDVFNGALPDTTRVLADPELPDPSICQPAEIQTELLQLELSSLRADHTGAPNPMTDDCAGSDRGDGVARGYLTADVVERCAYPPTVTTWLRPEWGAQGGYFAATATSTNNALWGDYFYVNPGDNFAQSEPAISVAADPDRFGPGDYTFYGRYVGFDGSDARAPLGSWYLARFLNGGPFSGGTRLLIWRDNRQSAFERRPCGQLPTWLPLGEQRVVLTDEEEQGRLTAGLAEVCPGDLPTASFSCRVVDDVVSFGYLSLDLWLGDGTPAQAWVTTVLSAEDRYSVAHGATRLDDLCLASPAIPTEPVVIPSRP